MRTLVSLVALFLIAGTPALAEQELFGTGTGADQAKACNAARQSVRTQAGRKKVEFADCTCKTDGGQASCTVKGTTR